MLERKLYNKLLAWKNEPIRENALLIEGARRVGKTTLVKEFAANEYESCLFIDFSHPEPGTIEAFEAQRNNLDAFFMYVCAANGVTLRERRSLVVFDEVQRYPKAREFIKDLVADGRYDYIETGSLISIKKNIDDIVIPSEEHSVELTPLDFEEFLWAMGEKPLASLIRSSYESLTPLPDALHEKAMRFLREYMLVGGMPRPVQRYADSHDLHAVDEVKRDILALYRKDIARYAKGHEHRVTELFDSIPAQLSRHEKKFSPTLAKTGARSDDYAAALFWLDDARILNRCYNATDPHVGLALYEERPTVKCYMADTGLLTTLAFADKGETTNRVFKDVLFGKLDVNKGMLIENLVAQQLRSRGHRLYFFSRDSRVDAAERMEIDFLITKPYAGANFKTRVCPIEVKSKNRYKTTSLNKFKEKYGRRIGMQYILHPRSLSVEGELVRLPLYMAFCL